MRFDAPIFDGTAIGIEQSERIATFTSAKTISFLVIHRRLFLSGEEEQSMITMSIETRPVAGCQDFRVDTALVIETDCVNRLLANDERTIIHETRHQFRCQLCIFDQSSQLECAFITPIYTLFRIDKIKSGTVFVRTEACYIVTFLRNFFSCKPAVNRRVYNFVGTRFELLTKTRGTIYIETNVIQVRASLLTLFQANFIPKTEKQKEIK